MNINYEIVGSQLGVWNGLLGMVYNNCGIG